MPNNMSNYAENKVLDHVLGTTAFTKPSGVYLALFTSDPTDAGTGTEVSGGSYARKVITFNASSNGSTSNAADVLFAAATASWGSVTHIGLLDALTGGNLLWHGPVAEAKTIGNGDEFKLGAGKLTISIN